MSVTNENLKVLMSKMEEFVTTKTVVGEPMTMGDTTIIPLVDVSFGMATGVTASSEGGDGADKDGGGGGMGAKMTPAAMLVVSADGSVQLLNVKSQENASWQAKVIDMIPGILSKFNLADKFGKKDKDEEAPEIVFEEIVIEE
ncbi:MAG: sporulation protein [Defluviitaleaceae bacterium]|jgi:uncharacterized spore protein YtfJ|nr:sporulation protein [Defluviitaleaceae bacterium]